MSIADRIAGWLRPSASQEEQGTRWRGASQSLRSLASWVPSAGSGTSDLPAHEQRTLRARSRDAFRGHPLARAALTRSRTNIVGTGLMCRPQVDHETLGISADEAERINTMIRARWEMWAEDPMQCDMEATLDIYGMQGLALLSAMVSGDVFVLTPSIERTGSTCALKLQIIEADRVSNPNNGPDAQALIDGVALDPGGMPRGYWVRDSHPGDAIASNGAKWEFFAAFGEATGRRRVLHVWNDKERPGQVRGAPYLAPVLEPLVQLSRFGGAELMAAVISAMLTVFIERDAVQTDGDGNEIVTFDQPSINLGNGAIVDLAPGERAKEVNPSRPNAQFDPFFMAVTKQIGAALELPVDELLLHYQSSYSAARAAMLQAWRFYTLRRWLLTQQFCAPVYGLFLDEQVASGALRLRGYEDPVRRRAWARALWIGPARGAMDEEKEARAAKLRIDTGVSNEAMETASMTGEDWQTVYAQRVREIERRKADGTFVEQSNTFEQIKTTRDEPADAPAKKEPEA
jgi:lambda family phage portal protein